jgi:hypothetical protein
MTDSASRLQWPGPIKMSAMRQTSGMLSTHTSKLSHITSFGDTWSFCKLERKQHVQRPLTSIHLLAMTSGCVLNLGLVSTLHLSWYTPRGS